MRVIYESTYKRNGNNIKEIRIRDITRKQAREIRQRLYNKYSRVEMTPFEMYEDRPMPNIQAECYKGYIFYIWLNSKI